MPKPPWDDNTPRPEADGVTWTHPQLEPLSEVASAERTQPYNSDTSFDFSEQPELAFELHGYKITGYIGSGGMGHVFAAWECELDREVAIKVMRQELLDKPEMRLRFTTEVRTTAQLSHPCIPPIFTSGRLPDGRPYLVMKRLHGESLQSHLNRRANTSEDLPKFTQHFIQICQAVAHAHSHTVIHRDLKPANVVVENYGGIQVLDWGIAKQLKGNDSTPSLTVDGGVMGSLAYMPPEQFRGEWDRVDERADVFALGAILCEILTRNPPHAWGPAADDNLAKAIENLKTSGHDSGLVDIAVRCLRPEPADRPANAAAVIQLLDAYRATVVERLRNVEIDKAVASETARREKDREIASIKERAKESRQRRRRLLRIGAAAVVGLFLVVGFVLAKSEYRQIENAETHVVLGEAAIQEGDREKAFIHYKNARESYEALMDSSLLWNRHRLGLELGKVYTRLAELYELTRDPAAQSALQQALTLLTEAGNAQVVDKDELALALAKVHHNWGVHHQQNSRFQQAVESFREALRYQEGIVAQTIRQQSDYKRSLALIYGYMGDAQRELHAFKSAMEFYKRARDIRKELAEADPSDLDSQCLHTRDFANFGTLYARDGKFDLALEQYRARRHYYDTHEPPFPERLPGKYWTERAATNCAIAEFLLEPFDSSAQSDTLEISEAEQLLVLAKAECDLLRGECEELECPADLRSVLARYHVCRARLQFVRNDVKALATDAEYAIDLLKSLVGAGQAQAMDYYHLAIAHALLDASGETGHRFVALDWLDMAGRKNYTDIKRVERDGLFQRVLGEHLQIVTNKWQ